MMVMYRVLYLMALLLSITACVGVAAGDTVDGGSCIPSNAPCSDARTKTDCTEVGQGLCPEPAKPPIVKCPDEGNTCPEVAGAAGTTTCQPGTVGTDCPDAGAVAEPHACPESGIGCSKSPHAEAGPKGDRGETGPAGPLATAAVSPAAAADTARQTTPLAPVASPAERSQAQDTPAPDGAVASNSPTGAGQSEAGRSIGQGQNNAAPAKGANGAGATSSGAAGQGTEGQPAESSPNGQPSSEVLSEQNKPNNDSTSAPQQPASTTEQPSSPSASPDANSPQANNEGTASGVTPGTSNTEGVQNTETESAGNSPATTTTNNSENTNSNKKPNLKGDADSSISSMSSVWVRVPLLIVVALACILV